MNGILPLGGRRTSVIEPPPVTPPAPLPPSAFRGRLRTQGRQFIDAAGAVIAPIMCSGFPPAGQIAKGQEADARAFLRFMKTKGVWFVRSLSAWLGTGNAGDRFSPQQGLAALPRLLQIAREEGIYVIPVGLVDTGLDTGYNWRAHLDRVVAISYAAEMPVQLIQEFPHATQDPRALQWAKDCVIPSSMVFCAGSVHAAHDMDTSLSWGSFAATHVLRGVPQPERHHAVAQVFRALGKPFVSLEPDRAMDAATWEKVARQCVVDEMGLAFHSPAVRDGKIPVGTELAGLEAMVCGMLG